MRNVRNSAKHRGEGSGSRAGADGWLSPRHRRAQAQRHQHDLRRARYSNHGLRPHGAGRRHPRHLVSPRAERRQRSGHRRLSDKKARHLPHGVGSRFSQWPDCARQCHDQLLPDDPDQRLVGARDRRPAARRLRGDGPAGDRQAAVQGGFPRAACGRHRHRRGAGDPGGCLGASGRRLPRSAGEGFFTSHERGCRRQVARQGHRRGAGPDSGSSCRQARARCPQERQAPADHSRQRSSLRAGR